LTYTPAPNANGSATVSVQLQDNGGTADGGVDTSAVQTFVISVTAVNDVPSFTAANPPAVDQGAGPQSIPGWVTSVTMGPPNETSQSVLAYLVSAVSNAALFTALPTVAANGTLSYTPAAGVRGTSTFAVAVRDNGGTANGGVDTSLTQTFTILVNPTVQLPGGAGTNTAVVSRVGANLRVVNNGAVLLNVPLASFTKLTVLGAANKADTVTVDPVAGGGLTLAHGVTFDGGTGAATDTLRVQGTAGADTLAVRSQTVPTPANLVAFQSGANALSVRFTGTEQVQLVGQGGNDTYAIDALPVNVTIIDTGGNDTLDFSQAASGVTVNLGIALRQTVFGGATGLTLQATPIENVIGTALNDTITGNAVGNRLTGGAGNDVINGAAGNDLIFGGMDNDTLLGGAGNNVLVGGDGNDFLRSGTGRNVMIGGLGTDDILGNAGAGAQGDLLVGGRTLYDDSQPDLVAILAEWSSARTLAQRRARLTAGLGPNGTPFLRTTAPNPSVLDDGAADAVFGGARFNWLLPS
jgi:Ca2+-binding RTX toxin-like protein